MKRNNIRIAIQKSGRLQAESFKTIKSWGLSWTNADEKSLIVACDNADVEILFVRHSDIPRYVEGGAADFGFVGRNVLIEEDFDVRIVEELDYGQCKLVIAAPVDSDINGVADLDGERIATSYAGSLRNFLKAQKLSASIVHINGAVEAAPALGLADAICDLTQTGRTLKANGLREVATIATSTALLIESPFENLQKTAFKLEYLQGVDR